MNKPVAEMTGPELVWEFEQWVADFHSEHYSGPSMQEKTATIAALRARLLSLLSSGQRAEEMEKALKQIKSDAADPDFATLANGHVLKRIYETAREALKEGGFKRMSNTIRCSACGESYKEYMGHECRLVTQGQGRTETVAHI